MNRPSEPLNAEERDLAQRLARMGGARAPAPALDARILAMARAAVEATPEAPAGTTHGDDAAAPPAPTAAPDPKIVPLRRRTPLQRWPMGLGLAASLVLAAGLGWKLHVASRDVTERPLAEAAPAAAEDADGFEVGPPLPREETADAAAAPAADADADASLEPFPEAKLATRAPAAPGASETARPVLAEKDALPAADAEARAAPSAMMGAAAAPPAPPAPAAPPPPPPQPASTAKVIVDDSGDGRIDVDALRTPRSDVGGNRSGAAEYTRTPLDQRRQQISANRTSGEAPASPSATVLSPAERARLNTGITRSGATENDSPAVSGVLYDERPPVTADSTEFRQAWLQRIRALVAKGDTAAAVDSLKEFRRRYPDAELPDDLRKLLPAQPSNP